jgi:AcrR family transcriptional regulator
MAPKPARGTRPSNRRAGILSAAAELFHTRGYEHVSISDIADAVAIGPSALYRHFSSKQELLREAVRGPMAAAQEVIGGVDLADPAALPAMAELALSHAELGTLWLRESRHLPLVTQREIAGGVQGVASHLTQQCGLVRPDLNASGADLLAWSLLGVLLSPSFHQLEVPPAAHAGVLVALMARTLKVPLPLGFVSNYDLPASAGLLPHSRREALLLNATKLFAQRRFASVGIEDVAASLGIAGPGIYNYFTSKSELLALALSRGGGLLYLQVAQVFSTATTPAAALGGLIRSYVEFAITQPDLVAILIAEVRNLDEPFRQQALAAQRDYTNEWIQLLNQVDGAPRHAMEARIQTEAALTVINTVTQVHHLRTASNADSAITATITHLLGLPHDVADLVLGATRMVINSTG